MQKITKMIELMAEFILPSVHHNLKMTKMIELMAEFILPSVHHNSKMTKMIGLMAELHYTGISSQQMTNDK